MMWITRRSLVLSLAPLAAGCSQARMLGAVDFLTADTGTLRVEGASFGPDPRQRLDVYAPADARNAPAVLFLYGGGWRQGSRAQYRFAGQALAARGFVAMVADYRLYPEARFPAFVQDAALACAWARANLASHGGDPARLSLLGHSAGGFNALVAALDPRWLAAVGMRPAELAGVVALAPPTGAELARSRWAQTIFAQADPPGSAWPIRLAATGSAAAPPITLVAGASDVLIRAADVRALGAAIGAAGGRVETHVLEGAGHIEVLADLWWGGPRAEAWTGRLSS